MNVYIGADHRGYTVGKTITDWLSSDSIQVVNLTKENQDMEDDYVDVAALVARHVVKDRKEGEDSFGIVICGSGAGVCISANKIRGIRCCLGFNEKQIMAARTDDDCTILALPGDYVSPEEVKNLVTAFLHTSFVATEKHVRRLEKIKELEETL